MMKSPDVIFGKCLPLTPGISGPSVLQRIRAFTDQWDCLSLENGVNKDLLCAQLERAFHSETVCTAADAAFSSLPGLRTRSTTHYVTRTKNINIQITAKRHQPSQKAPVRNVCSHASCFCLANGVLVTNRDMSITETALSAFGSLRIDRREAIPVLRVRGHEDGITGQWALLKKGTLQALGCSRSLSRVIHEQEVQ